MLYILPNYLMPKTHINNEDRLSLDKVQYLDLRCIFSIKNHPNMPLCHYIEKTVINLSN